MGSARGAHSQIVRMRQELETRVDLPSRAFTSIILYNETLLTFQAGCVPTRTNSCLQRDKKNYIS